MRRLVSVAVLLVACAAAAVLAGAKEEKSSTRTYKIVFDNAFGLTEGGDFRVGGVRAGSTPSFEATDDEPPKAEVTAEITEPGFTDFRKDAHCSIRPQSLIGEYYVDCQPGTSKEKIAAGGTVPVKQTTSTVPIDLVNNVLRTPYRDRLRLLITELGTGLAGRPQDLAEVLRRAHPGLRETSKTLQVLGRQNRTIERFIVDADTVVGELEKRKTEVSRFIRESADTAEISASRREELREGFRKLPGFLDELRPTMARLGEVSDAQVPLLRDARAAAPALNTFLTRLGPFADASRPALRSLGDASRVGTRAFARGRDEVRELRTLARSVPGTTRPLRQFLQAMDDDRYAYDEDPRALVEGPAESDISNRSGKGGFTGFEAIANYFFWQSLSLNAYDDVSHMLRLSVTVSECSQYFNNTPLNPENTPEETAEAQRLIDKCNQFLGPNQPGITTPDFTQGDDSAQLASTAEQSALRRGERRGEGEPDAGPLPGQRDISEPQVTLPPEIKDLLPSVGGDGPQVPAPTPGDLRDAADGLLGGGGANADDSAGAPTDRLLDYLLAP